MPAIRLGGLEGQSPRRVDRLGCGSTRALSGVVDQQYAFSGLALGSRAVARRLNDDWTAKYGHGIELLETFVDRERFRGTCYRAAGWVHVGATAGRSRNDRDQTLSVPVKDIYLRPLFPDFRRRLCA